MNNEIVLYEAVSIEKDGLPKVDGSYFFMYDDFSGCTCTYDAESKSWSDGVEMYHIEDKEQLWAYWLRPLPNHVAVSVEKLEALEKCVELLSGLVKRGEIMSDNAEIKQLLSNLSTIK